MPKMVDPNKKIRSSKSDKAKLTTNTFSNTLKHIFAHISPSTYCYCIF